MFKRYAIHLGNGLFLSSLVSAVENAGSDLKQIAEDAAPVLIEVSSLAGAFVSKSPVELIEHVAKLAVLLPQFAAEVHEIVSVPVGTSTTTDTSQAAVAAAIAVPGVKTSFQTV